jgi:hypothetical protein
MWRGFQSRVVAVMRQPTQRKIAPEAGEVIMNLALTADDDALGPLEGDFLIWWF